MTSTATPSKPSRIIDVLVDGESHLGQLHQHGCGSSLGETELFHTKRVVQHMRGKGAGRILITSFHLGDPSPPRMKRSTVPIRAFVYSFAESLTAAARPGAESSWRGAATLDSENTCPAATRRPGTSLAFR